MRASIVFATVVLSVTILAIGSANATEWCGPSPDRFPERPKKGAPGGPTDTCEKSAGDPIQTSFDGSQYHSFDDVFVKGRAIDFEYSRYYINSLFAGLDSPAFKEAYFRGARMFGGTNYVFDGYQYYLVYYESTNWTHSYSSYISTEFAGLDAVAGHGRTHPFKDTDYDPDNGFPSMHELNNTRLFKFSTPYQGFVWISEEGMKYYYRSCANFPVSWGAISCGFSSNDPLNNDAFLVEIEDQSSLNRMTFDYYIPGEDGVTDTDYRAFMLKTVTMDTGKVISFEYDEKCRHPSMTADCDPSEKYTLLKKLRLGLNGPELVQYDYYDFDRNGEHDSVLKSATLYEVYFDSGVAKSRPVIAETYLYHTDDSGNPYPGYLDSITRTSTTDATDQGTLLAVKYATPFRPNAFSIKGRNFDFNFDGGELGFGDKTVTLDDNITGEHSTLDIITRSTSSGDVPLIVNKASNNCSVCAKEFYYSGVYSENIDKVPYCVCTKDLYGNYLCGEEDSTARPFLCGRKNKNGSFDRFKWDRRGNLVHVEKGVADYSAPDPDARVFDYEYDDYVSVNVDGIIHYAPTNRRTKVVRNDGVISPGSNIITTYVYQGAQLLDVITTGQTKDISGGVKDVTHTVRYQRNRLGALAFEGEWELKPDNSLDTVRMVGYSHYERAANIPPDDPAWFYCPTQDDNKVGLLCETIEFVTGDISSVLRTRINDYDPLGRPVQMSTPDGRERTMEYSYDGRLKSITTGKNGAASSKRFSYTATGELKMAADGEGNIVLHEYLYDQGGPFVAEEQKKYAKNNNPATVTHTIVTGTIAKIDATEPSARRYERYYRGQDLQSPLNSVEIDIYTTGTSQQYNMEYGGHDVFSRQEQYFDTDGTADCPKDVVASEIFPGSEKIPWLQITKREDHTVTTPNLTCEYFDREQRLRYSSRKVDLSSNNKLKGKYSYDAHGNLTVAQDGNGNVTIYEYDDFGRIMMVRYAIGDQYFKRHYDYYPDGLVKTEEVISYSSGSAQLVSRKEHVRDYLGRTTGTKFYSGTTLKSEDVATYDGAYLIDAQDTCATRLNSYRPDFVNGTGSLSTVSDKNGATHFIYDALARIKVELRSNHKLVDYSGSFQKCLETQYMYDSTDRVSMMTLPDGHAYKFSHDGWFASTIELAYPNSGTPVEILKDLTFEPFGAIGSMTGGGVTTTRTHNQNGDVMEIRAVADSLELKTSVSHFKDRSVSHLTIVKETPNRHINETIGYDYYSEPTLKKTDVSGIRNGVTYNWARNFTYDDIQNRKTQHIKDGYEKDEVYDYTKNGSGNSELLNEVVDPILKLSETTNISPLDSTFNSDLFSLADLCKKGVTDGDKSLFAHERCAVAARTDFEAFLKNHKLDVFMLIRALVRDYELNKLFSEIAAFRAKKDTVSNKSADESTVIKLADRIKALDPKGLQEVEQKTTDGVAVGDGSTTRITKVYFGYDGVGNTTKEVVYYEEGARTIGGTALCYRYDERDRMVKVEWDSTFSDMTSDSETPETRLPPGWLYATCTNTLPTPRVFAELSAFWYDHKNRRIAEKRFGTGTRFFTFDLHNNMTSEVLADGTTLQEYVWLGTMPVAQVYWAKMETENPPGGCTPTPGCGGTPQCSVVDVPRTGTKSAAAAVILLVVLPLGLFVNVRLLRGRWKYSLMFAGGCIAVVVILHCTAVTYQEPVVFWYHVDHLNTPMQMTDKFQALVWDVEQKHPFGDFAIWTTQGGPYGKDANGQDVYITPTNPIRFPGQYFYNDRSYILPAVYKNDEVAFSAAQGPYYNWNRWYQPGVGRYLSIDLLGMTSSNAFFTYSKNNPTGLADPFGLFCDKDFVNHYYFGKGKMIDLEAVGLLSQFKNSSSVRASVAEFKALIQDRSGGWAGSLCADCDKGTKIGSFPFQKNSVTNVAYEPCLFAVGHSTFFRAADCDVTADCEVRSYSYSCNLRFWIRDWFQDPINLNVETGGIPYPIIAFWKDTWAGNGYF